MTNYLSKCNTYKEKRDCLLTISFNEMRQLHRLPTRVRVSTVSAIGLNFCVRNENRWIPDAIVTAMVIYSAYRRVYTLFFEVVNLF